MPARRSPVIQMAAPMSCSARPLMVSSTLCSGRTVTRRFGFALSRSDTVFIVVSFRHLDPCYTVRSHVRVVRTPAALGHHPADILQGVLDVAGLAVNAIGGVDLQARLAALGHEFIDPCRTVPRLRPSVNREVDV